MENDKYLKKFENKAFEVAFLDGLFEIMFGLIWMGFGLGSFLYEIIPAPLNSFFGLIISLIAATMNLMLKYYITRPRMGVVKLSNRQKARSKKMLVISMILVVITVLIVIFTVVIPNTVFFSILGFLGFGTAFIFGIIPFAILAPLAFIFNYNRLYAYGVILGASLFINECFHIINIPAVSGISNFIGGCIVLVAGMIIFIQFMKNNPIPRGEELAQEQ